MKFNNKTIVIPALALAILGGAFSIGCTKNSNTQAETQVKNVDLTKLSSDIETGEILNFMPMIQPAVDFPAFAEIQDKIVEGFASIAAMNVHFEDVVVVKTTDTDATIDALNNYLKSDTVKLYADGYGGEHNINSIQNAKIEAVGDYVYYIASPNVEKIETTILDYLK